MARVYTHRERVIEALNHREPDRVPFELGSSTASGITIACYENLARHFGIEPTIKVTDRMQQLAAPDERILQAFDIDIRPVWLGKPDGWTDEELPGNGYKDEWGVVRHKPEGSFYYDLTGSPLAGEIALQDVVNHKWPDPDDPGRYRGLVEQVDHLRETTDYALMLNVPPAFVHISQYVRGFVDWFMDLKLDKKLAGAIMDAVLDVNLTIALKAISLVGDKVDLIRTSDDIGHQNNLGMSEELYREMIKPRQKRYYQAIHDATLAKVWYHTCGSVYTIIEDLIEVGVDVLNPVQVAAANMDPARLKKEFGSRISFAGAIDTQRVLPFGSPKDVEDEVKRRIEQLAEGGGYILGAVHNIQPDVPPENIVALFEAGKRYGRYGVATTA